MFGDMEKMLKDATAARDAMGEMKKLFEDVKPLMEEQQAHTVKGEKTPNEVFAKIYRAIAEATDRAVEIMPPEAQNPLMANSNEINKKLAKAYEENDEMAISLAQAEQMGASYMMMYKLITDMHDMFDTILKELGDMGSDGPGLWTPGDD